MENFFQSKTVLVTGGSGSIGSELVKQLLKYKISKVIIFGRDEIKHFLIKKRMDDDRIETVIGDVRDYRSLENIFLNNKIDLIYHAAAMKHVVVAERYPLECVKTNIFGTYNVVDLAKKHNVPKMITISTDKSAYPVNTMGASKLIAENITLNANFTCVRFGNVANSRGSVIPILIEGMVHKKSITITDPNITRFLIRIPEAIHLIFKATLSSQGGDIFILKMRAFQLGDLLNVLLERIAPKLNISEKIDVNIIGAIQGEKLHEDLINETESDHILNLEDMYIIVRDLHKQHLYPHASKIQLKHYSSNNVELMGKAELEKIIDLYIKQVLFTDLKYD